MNIGIKSTPNKQSSNFTENDPPTFIDLFSGIGGFRMGFTSMGYECVASCEINPVCREVYQANFNESPLPDVALIEPKLLPDFDVVLAGFPCQPFSICGLQKGFEDTRGTLFFEIARLVAAKNPKVVVLENVKHLIHHNNGHTLKVILNTLEFLGYAVSYKLLNASDFGLPQHRERIVIVAHRDGLKFNFDLMEKKPRKSLRDFLDTEGDFEFLEPGSYTIIENQVRQKSGLIFAGYRNKKLRVNGVRENTEHLSRAHKQPNRIYSVDGIHPTLPSQETSGRYFIYFPETGRVRRLLVSECYRIMGFPEDFKRARTLTDRFKQIGNSVSVKMMAEVAYQIKAQGLI